MDGSIALLLTDWSHTLNVLARTAESAKAQEQNLKEAGPEAADDGRQYSTIWKQWEDATESTRSSPTGLGGDASAFVFCASL